MKASSSELRYRASTVQEATPAGLVIVLYDILVGDLRQAISFMQSGNVECRCSRLKHALSVLQVLEGSLDRERGGGTAESLSHFYSHIRAQILLAQFQDKASILEQQIALVLSVREAWQEVASGAAAQSSSNQAAGAEFSSARAAAQRVETSNWSA